MIKSLQLEIEHHVTDDSGKISAAEIANQFCPEEKIENIEKVVKCLDENEDGEIGRGLYIYIYIYILENM